MELGKVFVLYRQPTPEAQEFELLLGTWAEALKDVSDEELLEAMRHIRATSRFFPVPADVIRRVEERRRRLAPEPQALPERTRTNEEQVALNMAGARRILDRLRKEMRRKL